MKRKLDELPVEIIEKILMYTNLQCVKISEFNYLLPHIEKHILENLENLMYSVSNKRQRLNRIGEATNIVCFLEARDIKQHIKKTLFEFKTKDKKLLQQYQKVQRKWSHVNIGCDQCFSYNKKLTTCYHCFKDLCCINTNPCSNCHLNTCNNCKHTCDMCQGSHCKKCTQICHKTFNTRCKNCMDSCNSCKLPFVSECVYQCSKCTENTCLTDLSLCECNKIFCYNCTEWCSICNYTTCNNCSTLAENQYVCSNCNTPCTFCGTPLLYNNLFGACISCYYDNSITSNSF